MDEFQNNISYNFIDDILPVNITFNHTAQQCVKEMGAANGYLYIDSGIILERADVVRRLYELHISGPYGMTAARTDTDAGTFLWFNEGRDYSDESGQDKLFKDGHFVIPIGKTINLHIQIFDNSIFENYNHCLLPDIFASHCTESTFSFLNAAIHKKFIIHKDIIVKHYTSMDGASSGFRPELAKVLGWQHLLPFSHKKILDIIADKEGIECGFGYEECQNILMHDKTQFDKNGYAKQPGRLRNFILKNLYLPYESFDYEQPTFKFIK
ncbi:MAG: hypothetical protein NTU97_02395 [Candidatus Magasanikbacteria bacterium]|nr:hypothetical protein [Candidatus Magasanikbacteria bacterium]